MLWMKSGAFFAIECMSNCISSPSVPSFSLCLHMSLTGRYTRKSLSGCPICRKLWLRSMYFISSGASLQMLLVGDMSTDA